jgi:hypothetical protein
MSKLTDIQKLLVTIPDGIFGLQSETALAIAPRTVLVAIQRILGVLPDGCWGAKSEAALEAQIHAPSLLWPFTVEVDGPDLVVRNIVITCFGGGFDPQDTGDTASGVSTLGDHVCGVSLPMNGLQYLGMRPREHAALDGSPIPRLPWGTLVEVSVGILNYTPPAGIIDLGPGKQASPSLAEPHALDLTPPAAQVFKFLPLHRLATGFSARGSYRIHGGAYFLKT